MLQVNDQTRLPDGWEMKYDFSTRRYYFIDHVSKKTTWEDPRIKFYQQQQTRPSPQVAAPARGPSNATHSSGGKESTNVTQVRRPGSSMKPSKSESSSSSSGEEEDGDADPFYDLHNLNEYEFEVRVLRSRYPTVDNDKIMTLLKENNGEMHKVEAILKEEKEAMLRKAEFQTKLSSLKREFIDVDESTLLKMLNKEDGNVGRCRGRLRAIQSENQRLEETQRLLEQKAHILKTDFPNADLGVILDVLRACTKASSKGSSSISPSSINMFEVRNKLTEMGLATPSNKLNRTGSRHSNSRPSVSPSPAMETRERSSSRTDKDRRSGSIVQKQPQRSPNQHEQHRRSLTSTEGRAASSTRRNSKDEPSTSNAVKGGRPHELFESGTTEGKSNPLITLSIPEVMTPDMANTTGAVKEKVSVAHGPSGLSHGPDLSLAKGPQASHRIATSARVQAQGPDSSLLQSLKIKENCATKARGSDRSLYHGPQSSLALGPRVIASS